MAGVTTTTIDDIINVAIQESQVLIPQRAILKNAITNYRFPGASVRIPKFGRATVQTATQGTDITTTADMATSSVTINNEAVAIRDIISDVADLSAVESIGINLGNMFGRELAGRINQDIFAMFDGFSTSIGDSTSAMSTALILEAKSILEKKGVNGPYFLAITPHQAEDLMLEFSQTTNASYRVSNLLTDKIQVSGELPPIYGVNILVVNDLATGSTAGKRDAADIKCGLFTKEALAMNTQWDVRVEKERDISLLGYEIVASTSYGLAEVWDDCGVEIHCLNNDD